MPHKPSHKSLSPFMTMVRMLNPNPTLILIPAPIPTNHHPRQPLQAPRFTMRQEILPLFSRSLHLLSMPLHPIPQHR